ncbi:MAG: metallophosphoesterase [Sulfolobales archaeon]
MSSVKVYAVGDVHGSRYFNLFLASLKSLINSRPDLIIFAGDMVDEGNAKELRMIVDSVKSKFGGVPIIAVFGNEEYHEVEEKFINEYPEVVWLNDSLSIIYVNNLRVGIVGSRGVLEKLTYWQKKNKPILEQVYRERPTVIRKLLSDSKKASDITIYVSHYAPTYATVKGEPDKVLPFMGSRYIEEVLRDVKPDIAIHAHAHNSRVLETILDGVKVYNVSLPARRAITVINATPPKDLTSYVKLH